MLNHGIWQVDKTTCVLQSAASLKTSLLLASSMHDVAGHYWRHGDRVLFGRTSHVEFEYYYKKNAREIYVPLQEVCGNSVLSYSQVVRWSNQCNSGREAIKDNEGRDFSKLRIFCRKCMCISRKWSAIYMWVTSPGTGFKLWYCSFNYSKSSWNTKGVSTLVTTSFDVRPIAMLFNCRHQVTLSLWNRRK